MSKNYETTSTFVKKSANHYDNIDAKPENPITPDGSGWSLVGAVSYPSSTMVGGGHHHTPSAAFVDETTIVWYWQREIE
jgi:hypothetical protein